MSASELAEDREVLKPTVTFIGQGWPYIGAINA